MRNTNFLPPAAAIRHNLQAAAAISCQIKANLRFNQCFSVVYCVADLTYINQ